MYRAEDPLISSCESRKGFGCLVTLPIGHGSSSWSDRKHRIVNEGTVFQIQLNNVNNVNNRANVSQSMNYDIVIHYKIEHAERWESALISVIRPEVETIDQPCGFIDPSNETELAFDLNGHKDVQTIVSDICLQNNNSYTIKLEFKEPSAFEDDFRAEVHIDYIALVPRIENSSLMTKSESLEILRRDYTNNNCDASLYESAYDSLPSFECLKTLESVRIAMSNGGDFCNCSTNGSRDDFCESFTGQCKCNPNVVGRKCDRCEVGFCNFPECLACDCNGHSQKFDYDSIECLDCADFTAGQNCEQCAEGYYGNPATGSCLPCRCPSTPDTNQYFADRCDFDPATYEIRCTCKEGYSGEKCDVCAENFYGNPEEGGGSCQRCECNGHIDLGRTGNCDRSSGRCLQCAGGWDGEQCEYCRDGLYHNSSTSRCDDCNCNLLGSDSTTCDRSSGQCQCKAHVEGRQCDQCEATFWKLGSGDGCEKCKCDPQGSANEKCDPFSGRCQCKRGYEGADCSILSTGFIIQSVSVKLNI